jgi:hypothetical protein
MVGLGLMCPHCGGALAGGDWNSFTDAFKHGPAHFFNAAKNEIINPNSDLKTKVIPAVKEVVKLAEDVVPIVGRVRKLVGGGARRWSPEARAAAKQRASNPNSHAAKVKAYLKKYPGTSLAVASRAVSNKS